MPLISVIIPAYNAEKTIQATIDSVLKQTFDDFELIVINDGSTDSTLEIVKSISDSRIKVFSYPNSGPQKSRNRGIAQSCGQYLAFLDADDLWTPDKLEAQLKALQEFPQAAGVYSWTNCIDEAGTILRRGPQLNFSGNIYIKLLLADFVGSGSNPLIRKQALVEVGNFDELLVAGQDWDMWLRVAEQFPFAVVPYPQVLYRQSAGSWSTKVERQEAGYKQVIEKAVAKFPEELKPIKKQIIANRYICLTFEALQGYADRKRGLLATRFLWTAIKNDPSLLRARVLLKAVLKIGVMIIFPAQQSQILLTKFKFLSNVDALPGYVRLNP